MNKIITILNVYNTKTNIPRSTKNNIAEFKGKIQAQIETNNPQTKRKRTTNNTGNANRSSIKKVTTGNLRKLQSSDVNKIRPFIMKIRHLTNNQKAYYINQARTNQTKKLSEIVKNARLRAYHRT